MNEFLELLIQAAKMEAAQGAKTSGMNWTSPKPKVDPTKAAQETAQGAKAIYDAFTGVGFTVEQSFELTKNILTPVKRV